MSGGEGQNGFLSSRRESEFTLFHIFLLFVPLRDWMMPNYPMISGHSFAQSGWHIKPSIRCGKMLNVQSTVLWLGWKQYIPTWLLYLPGKSGWLLARRHHSSSCRCLCGPFHIVTGFPHSKRFKRSQSGSHDIFYDLSLESHTIILTIHFCGFTLSSIQGGRRLIWGCNVNKKGQELSGTILEADQHRP